MFKVLSIVIYHGGLLRRRRAKAGRTSIAGRRAAVLIPANLAAGSQNPHGRQDTQHEDRRRSMPPLLDFGVSSRNCWEESQSSCRTPTQSHSILTSPLDSVAICDPRDLLSTGDVYPLAVTKSVRNTERTPQCKRSLDKSSSLIRLIIKCCPVLALTLPLPQPSGCVSPLPSVKASSYESIGLRYR